MELYADILVPLASDMFTYRVGEDIASSVQEGMAVAVPLGQRKVQAGIVWRLHGRKPEFKTKDIHRILLPGQLVPRWQMELWEWVAEYYMCRLGDVMRFALPSLLKPSGLSHEEFSKSEYKPKKTLYVALHPSLSGEIEVNEACNELKRSKAQYGGLMELCGLLDETVFSGGEVERGKLSVSNAVLKKLVERGIFIINEREAMTADADSHGLPADAALPMLSKPQSAAYANIREGFGKNMPVLLHGVTGSGKTEIYLHLIAEELARGRSVLYLMPEIAMTSQLVARVKRVFGERVTVYHSKISDNRRAAAYRRLGSGEGGELVLGVRSSVFLPIPRLGLIIADEEHDPSYKQNDAAPRYNARDCAVYMARRYGAKCLLASATPSIESYMNALNGKYSLVSLTERYGDARLPEIIISDTLRAVRRGERKVHFNKDLLDRMKAVFAAGRQTMLFQNRRGFAIYLECGECGWTAHCPRCSVTLSYHKRDDKLRCHVCGYSAAMVNACRKCGADALKPQGFGTEKVEDELAVLMPGARVARLDYDTATSAKKYDRIISSFERGETDILVGTQMITKGFDFPKLSLVGILNADNLLNYPDFRASERAYQLMKQVAGRAGRTDDSGEVVIQTCQPGNPVIIQVRNLDYDGMVRSQLEERRPFNYPPYGRIITVTVKYYKKELVEEGAGKLAANMRALFGDRVYGPHAPVLEKISNEHYLTIMLKVETGTSYAKVKKELEAIIASLSRDGAFRKLTVLCNVDPQ